MMTRGWICIPLVIEVYGGSSSLPGLVIHYVMRGKYVPLMAKYGGQVDLQIDSMWCLLVGDGVGSTLE